MDPPDTKARKIFDTTIDLLFLLDIILNFFTAYEIPLTKKLETSLKVIVVNYLTGWFLLDVIATLPF